MDLVAVVDLGATVVIAKGVTGDVMLEKARRETLLVGSRHLLAVNEEVSGEGVVARQVRQVYEVVQR